jgi:hypothetical protein
VATPLSKNIFLGGTPHMLKFWTSHNEYIDFLSNSASALNASLQKKLSSYSDSIKKRTSLNLNPLHFVL